MIDDKNNKKFSSKDLAAIGMGAATVAVTTMFLKVPTPATGGYLNLGDVVVIFLGLRLGWRNGFIASGLGSAIADLMCGYVVFMPVTFVAKGLEGGVAGFVGHKKSSLLIQVSGALAGAALMILLYSLWNWMILGYAPAIASVPGNLLQGFLGVTGAILLERAFNKRDVS